MNLARRSFAGQSLVEFALLMPVLVIIMLGIFDAGRAVFAYNTVSNAARQGVRVAIVDQNVAAIEAQARTALTSLDQAAAQVTFVPCGSSPIRIGCEVTVRVRYDWQAITPVIGNVLGPQSIQAETTMPMERIFVSP